MNVRWFLVVRDEQLARKMARKGGLAATDARSKMPSPPNRPTVMTGGIVSQLPGRRKFFMAIYGRFEPVLGPPLLASQVQPGPLLGLVRGSPRGSGAPTFGFAKRSRLPRKEIGPLCALLDLGALVTEVPANRDLEAVIVCLAIERRVSWS